MPGMAYQPGVLIGAPTNTIDTPLRDQLRLFVGPGRIDSGDLRAADRSSRWLERDNKGKAFRRTA